MTLSDTSIQRLATLMLAPRARNNHDPAASKKGNHPLPDYRTHSPFFVGIQARVAARTLPENSCVSPTILPDLHGVAAPLKLGKRASRAMGGMCALNIAEFMERYADADKGKPLTQAGPQCKRLQLPTSPPDRLDAILASAFWDSFFFSTAWFHVAQDVIEMPWTNRNAGQRIVVPRPHLDRFDLLLLHPGYPPKFVRPYIRIDQHISSDELYDGWIIASHNAGPGTLMQSSLHPGMATEIVASAQPFSLVVAALPDVEPTCVPSPLQAVKAGSNYSTAGVIGMDAQQRHGVTTAYHAVGSSTPVWVGGQSGTVVGSDPVSDSCFIALSNPPSSVNRKLSVMSGMLPRGQQSASFEGAAATGRNPVSTTIIGWDPQTPNVATHRQLRLYTRLDTIKGDSGAALTTNDDYVVGFAFDHTLTN